MYTMPARERERERERENRRIEINVVKLALCRRRRSMRSGMHFSLQLLAANRKSVDYWGTIYERGS